MIDQKIIRIKTSLSFFRDHYRHGVSYLISLLVVIILLILVMFYEVLRQPQPDFYASTEAGEVAKLTALDGPNKSATPLIQ